MSDSRTSSHSANSPLFQRFLKAVERLGNLLPHPVSLFAGFAVAVLLLSGIADYFSLAVVDPRPEGSSGRASDGMIRAVSLVNAEGLRLVLSKMVSNFTGFVPLGTVLVSMLGVGVAEKSGLLSAMLRKLVLGAPNSLLTFALVFAGILSNTASEMGYVVLVPLGGYIFLSVGRHPLAGMAAAFAGTSGGYSANLLIGTVDPLLAGISQEAARLIAPDYLVHPAVNWYFMMASTFVIALVGTWVTQRFVEPHLGPYEIAHADQAVKEASNLSPLSQTETRALAWAGLSVLVLAGLVASTLVPESGILRDPVTGSILKSPFMQSLVAFIFIFFLLPSVVYGKISGSITNDRDVIEGMSQAMSTLGLYIVLVFFAAQFVAYFHWSKLGAIFAVMGADFLKSIQLTGPLLFVAFILMCAFINLMIGSASAQWAVTAPIFVPMLMLVGYSPEVIQAAYRIGDSSTNIITPMMSYFGLILAFANRFDKRSGIGTIIATMLPYSFFFLLSWTLFFLVWVFVLKLPVGPGAATYFTP